MQFKSKCNINHNQITKMATNLYNVLNTKTKNVISNQFKYFVFDNFIITYYFLF